MFRVSDVAKRLGVSKSTIYALTASGRLRCARIGIGRGAIRYTEQHIEEFIAGAQPEIKEHQAAAPRVRLKHLRLD